MYNVLAAPLSAQPAKSAQDKSRAATQIGRRLIFYNLLLLVFRFCRHLGGKAVKPIGIAGGAQKNFRQLFLRGLVSVFFGLFVKADVKVSDWLEEAFKLLPQSRDVV